MEIEKTLAVAAPPEQVCTGVFGSLAAAQAVSK